MQLHVGLVDDNQVITIVAHGGRTKIETQDGRGEGLPKLFDDKYVGDILVFKDTVFHIIDV